MKFYEKNTGHGSYVLGVSWIRNQEFVFTFLNTAKVPCTYAVELTAIVNAHYGKSQYGMDNCNQRRTITYFRSSNIAITMSLT